MEKPKAVSKEEILELLKETAKPLNLNKLLEDGTLKKSGAWYIVVKADKIPSHVWKHVVEIEQIEREDLPVEIRLKIQDSSRQASALYKKIEQAV